VIDDLNSEQRGALDALKASRGWCPPGETLVEYEALSPAARARHSAHDHISICSRCQLVLLHTAEPQIEKPSNLRWMLPLAAITVLAVGVTLFAPNFRSNTPPDIVRGHELQALAPIGAVDSITEFSWQSPILADRYRIKVMRGSEEVWRGESRSRRIEAPAGAFDANIEYRWTVEALDREGDVRMTSPPQTFTLSRRR
jgi:hypothetical protein